MKFKTIALAGMALCIAAPAFAHHSFAMFDRAKVVDMSGTVKEYEWTNPHVWIHLVVADDSGKAMEWSFEMQAIAQDYAAGWRSDSVKPGDKISIEYHPLKDGSRGGQLMSATLASGQHLGPPANPRAVTPEGVAAAAAARRRVE
jgi:hypothetical protein